MLTYKHLHQPLGGSSQKCRINLIQSTHIEVLSRVVSVKLSVERGLALRGSSDVFGWADNRNHLGILK